MIQRVSPTCVGLLLAAVAISVFGVLAVAVCRCADGHCYEDIVVSGAGLGEVNGTYEFIGMSNARPKFQMLHGRYTIEYISDWWIRDGETGYYDAAPADTPPHDGWDSYAPNGQDPPPTLSGGEECIPCGGPQLTGIPDSVARIGEAYSFEPHNLAACDADYAVANLPAWAAFDATTGKLSGTPKARDIGVYEAVTIVATDAWNRTDTVGPFSIAVVGLTVVPLGDGGGILDRSIDRSTTDASGMLTNTFRMFDANGNPTCGVPLHVCVYQIDYTDSPPVRTLIDYQYVACDDFGRYQYTLPSYALDSPYYDVVLAFAEEPNLTEPWVPQGIGGRPAIAYEDAPEGTYVYEIGEPITGGCQILGDKGIPVVTTYIHVYLYAIDNGTRPPTPTLVNHWFVRTASGTSTYCLFVPTDGLLPGDYSLRLAFEDGAVVTYSIRLVAPSP